MNLHLKNTYEQVIISRKANGNDVILEIDPFFQLQQGQVVLIGEKVVLWMNDFLLNFAIDMSMRLRSRRKVPLTNTNADFWQ